MTTSLLIKYLLIQKNKIFIKNIFKLFFNCIPNPDNLKYYCKNTNSYKKKLNILRELIYSSKQHYINVFEFETIHEKYTKRPFIFTLSLFFTKKKIKKKLAKLIYLNYRKTFSKREILDLFSKQEILDFFSKREILDLFSEREKLDLFSEREKYICLELKETLLERCHN